MRSYILLAYTKQMISHQFTLRTNKSFKVHKDIITLDKICPNSEISRSEIHEWSNMFSGVEELNEAVKGCKKLSELNMSMNPLKQFPEAVTQLISLEELYLSDAGLDYLPANVGRLVRLRILELRDNKLSSLPKAIARFSLLQRLDIGQNDFTYLVRHLVTLLV